MPIATVAMSPLLRARARAAPGAGEAGGVITNLAGLPGLWGLLAVGLVRYVGIRALHNVVNRDQ